MHFTCLLALITSIASGLSDEKNKISEKELNEMDISNLPDKELKGRVIEILTEVGSRTDEHSKNFATGR